MLAGQGGPCGKYHFHVPLSEMMIVGVALAYLEAAEHALGK